MYLVRNIHILVLFCVAEIFPSHIALTNPVNFSKTRGREVLSVGAYGPTASINLSIFPIILIKYYQGIILDTVGYLVYLRVAVMDRIDATFTFYFLRASSVVGGGRGSFFSFFYFFPCSDHEQDWLRCEEVFFGLATNTLNVRNNNKYYPFNAM